jgi:hypothetical protein
MEKQYTHKDRKFGGVACERQCATGQRRKVADRKLFAPTGGERVDPRYRGW